MNYKWSKRKKEKLPSNIARKFRIEWFPTTPLSGDASVPKPRTKTNKQRQIQSNTPHTNHTPICLPPSALFSTAICWRQTEPCPIVHFAALFRRVLLSVSTTFTTSRQMAAPAVEWGRRDAIWFDLMLVRTVFWFSSLQQQAKSRRNRNTTTYQAEWIINTNISKFRIGLITSVLNVFILNWFLLANTKQTTKEVTSGTKRTKISNN